MDPATSDKTESYIAKLVELREKKGMTEEQARELLLTQLSVLRRYDGENGRRGRYGIRSVPLYSRYTETVSADPEDKTGYKASIFILRHGSAGLRYGRERNICIL